MRNKILNLAYNLCEIASPTGEEYEVLIYLENWLLKAGLCVERLELSPTRFNLFAYKHKKARYAAIFCTHLDTVRPFISARIENNILWGRGSCDAKGIAAAMIIAVLKQYEEGFEDLALLLTVGEEESSDGAQIANSQLKNRAKFLIIGEPTDLKAAYAQKGSLVFDLIAHGKEAHSALPALGSSALHKLIITMHSLVNHAWPCDDLYGETLLNIGLVAGGHARNMLAQSAKAQAIMRLSRPSREIISVIKSKLEADVKLIIKSLCEPFEYVAPKDFEKFLAGFGSDAPYLRDIAPALLLGPGSLALAHKENEHIIIDELLRGFEAYVNLAEFSRAN